MKRMLTMYQPNKEILEENGIDAIYYENGELLYVDCNGNDIYPDELEEELLEELQSRINLDSGEEV